MHPALVLFLLCLITPDDFTREVESAATQSGAKLEGGGGMEGCGTLQNMNHPDWQGNQRF